MGTFKKIGFAFSVMPNSVINDKNMSWKAQGIYAHLVSKPDGWQFSVDRIGKSKNGGSRQVRSGVKELEKLGYLIRKRQTSGRVDYILFSEPHVQNVTVAKRHSGKTQGLSKKDLNNKKELLCDSSESRRDNPMKKYHESVIELDKFGDPLPPREVKTKTPVKLITSIAVYYATLFNVPKEKLYFKYKNSIEEMVKLASQYHGKDFKRIEAEIKVRMLTAKKFMEHKNWGKMKMSTIVESWNEIPEWAKKIEV